MYNTHIYMHMQTSVTFLPLTLTASVFTVFTFHVLKILSSLKWLFIARLHIPIWISSVHMCIHEPDQSWITCCMHVDSNQRCSIWNAKEGPSCHCTRKNYSWLFSYEILDAACLASQSVSQSCGCKYLQTCALLAKRSGVCFVGSKPKSNWSSCLLAMMSATLLSVRTIWKKLRSSHWWENIMNALFATWLGWTTFTCLMVPICCSAIDYWQPFWRTIMRRTITTEKQVALMLQFLSTGAEYWTIGCLFGVSKIN